MAIGLVLEWLVVSVSLSTFLRPRDPAAAQTIAPDDARAAASLADSLMTTDLAHLDPQIAALAGRAVRRDPTVVEAWRLLAYQALANGRPDQARRIFAAINRLSRRDLPTQLWIIEDRVSDGDVAGALAAYDTALRIAPGNYDLLMPILVSAMNDPAIARAFAPHIAADPPWANAFYTQLINRMTPQTSVAEFFEAIRRQGPLASRDYVAPFVAALVRNRRFADAARVYDTLSDDARRSRDMLRNGDFALANPLPPLDWDLPSDSALYAEQHNSGSDASERGLSIDASDGDSGVAARQLLLLRPGTYRIAARVRASGAFGSVGWRVACADGDHAIDPAIATIRADIDRAGSIPITGTVTVPRSACPAQWLSIFVDAGEQTSGRITVENVRLAASGG